MAEDAGHEASGALASDGEARLRLAEVTRSAGQRPRGPDRAADYWPHVQSFLKEDGL